MPKIKDKKKGKACLFKEQLACPLKKRSCPLFDSRFTEDLDLYLYKGRSPKGLWVSPTDGACNTDPFNTQIYRASKSMIFGDVDMYEDYIEYDRTGRIKMTQLKCLAWRQMRMKWARMTGRVKGAV